MICNVYDSRVIWFPCYVAYDFIHDFVTDKLGNFSNVSIAGKLGFLGWNIVCLGHLFGFIST